MTSKRSIVAVTASVLVSRDARASGTRSAAAFDSSPPLSWSEGAAEVFMAAISRAPIGVSKDACEAVVDLSISSAESFVDVFEDPAAPHAVPLVLTFTSSTDSMPTVSSITGRSSTPATSVGCETSIAAVALLLGSVGKETAAAPASSGDAVAGAPSTPAVATPSGDAALPSWPLPAESDSKSGAGGTSVPAEGQRRAP